MKINPTVGAHDLLAIVVKLNEYIALPVEQWPIKLFSVVCDDHGKVDYGELRNGIRFARQLNSSDQFVFVLLEETYAIK